MTKLALVQAAALADPAANLQTLLRFSREAADRGCQALCFPECFLTGYLPEQASRLSISRSDPLLQQVSQAARQLQLDILTGFMERRADACFITQGIFRRDGTRDFYAKTHLGKREALFFSPGDRLEVFPLSCGLTVGIQLCVETHYPQITQTLALRGAQVIFAPHAVPRVSGDRQAIWSKYIPARSYDNRVYLACCNLWDESRYGGGCLVTGPRGEITAADFGDRESLLVFAADTELTDSFRDPSARRSAHFYPALRRPELYE